MVEELSSHAVVQAAPSDGVVPPKMQDYLTFQSSPSPASPTRKSRKRRRFFLVSLFFLTVSLVVFVGGAAALFVFLPVDASGAEREFTIDVGTPLEEIVVKLESGGLVRNGLAFALLLRFQERAQDVKAGTFMLSSAMTPRRIADILTAQAPPERDLGVTIPEGFTTFQIAERLTAQGVAESTESLRNAHVRVAPYDFLASCAAAAGTGTCTVAFDELEGYLFPDTYRFKKSTSPDDIAAKFLANFEAKFSSDLRREAVLSGRSLQDIIILASLLEEEAKSDADRPVIAGIFVKRLEIGMALQVDATVLYAKERGLRRALDDRTLLSEDLKIDSPYNTYAYAGLPPGPIANPGLKSLLAALRPEASTYLYYLHTPDGQTVFSQTLAEHNVAKARYLR